VFRLGDQGAVIASLAGDGIAIALTSGIDAAAALLRDGAQAAQAFQNDFSLRAARPLAIASGLRYAAENPKTRRSLMHLFHRVPYLLTVGAALTRIAK
jgi:hypothetical protein